MGDDIRQKMPIESIDYDILTEEWKEITTNVHKENNLFNACCSKCKFSFVFIYKYTEFHKNVKFTSPPSHTEFWVSILFFFFLTL